MIVGGFSIGSTATAENGQRKKGGKKEEVKINVKVLTDHVGTVISLVETINTHVLEGEDPVRNDVNIFSDNGEMKPR